MDGKRKPTWKSQGKWKYISVPVMTSNICDLKAAILEILIRCSSRATILESVLVLKTDSLLLLLLVHFLEHGNTDYLIYYFLVENGCEAFEWFVIRGCCLYPYEGRIPRSVIMLLMCIFWRILFTNSDDWLEQLLMWYLKLSYMWWIQLFFTIEVCILIFFIFILYKNPTVMKINLWFSVHS